MKAHFKITGALLAEVRNDLTRPHPFAFERVGWISVGASQSGDCIYLIARSYQPVADDDYLPDDSVGAMMGPEAIRKALQSSRKERVGMFHVHTHGGEGLPGFSGLDLREMAKFVPNFLQLSPQIPHGALVLSNDSIFGHYWLSEKSKFQIISEFNEIGMPLKKWKGDYEQIR